MNEQHYIIDIDEQRMPYNTYMVLPLDVLTKIASVISSEILKGLVDDNGMDKVILHVNLDRQKIIQIKDLASPMKKRLEVVHK